MASKSGGGVGFSVTSVFFYDCMWATVPEWLRRKALDFQRRTSSPTENNNVQGDSQKQPWRVKRGSRERKQRADMRKEIGFSREEIRSLSEATVVLEDQGWQAVWDPRYAQFYFGNASLGLTQWEPPACLAHYDWASWMASGSEQNLLALAQETEEAKREVDTVSMVGTEEQGQFPDSAQENTQSLTPMELYTMQLRQLQILEREDNVMKEKGRARGPARARDMDLQSRSLSHMTSFQQEEQKTGGTHATPPLAMALGSADRLGGSPLEVTQAVGDDKMLRPAQETAQSLGTQQPASPQDETPSETPSPADEEDLPPQKVLYLQLSSGMPEDMDADLVRYWAQRHSLFWRFNEGVQLDRESWFSVTPEVVARHHAKRCRAGVVVDAFCGVGGNTIQLAATCKHVIAVEINADRLLLARQNLEVYSHGSALQGKGRVDFVAGDALRVLPQLKADVVFLSPPWGGPSYLEVDAYDTDTMLQPVSGFQLLQLALQTAPSVALFLPKNTPVNHIRKLWAATAPHLPCRVERVYLNGKFKALTVYIGVFAEGSEERGQ